MTPRWNPNPLIPRPHISLLILKISITSIPTFHATSELIYLFVFINLLAFHNTAAFSILPQQPLGLSHDVITNLARRRYGTRGRDDENPLQNTVTVITGAAGGIGASLAGVIHRLGGTIVALDRNTAGLEQLRDSLGSSSRVVIMPTQHEDLGSVARSAETIKSQFDSIDLLINNAGMSYPGDAQPGQSRMMSAHGYDLAFTVNYLSHFLLVEKLKPLLSSPRSRIVHLTSSFHWKVDGSELIPTDGGGAPLAYQSDPSLQGPKHIERSYANTKLAQIWHSRSIRGFDSVCACPTWVGTGIMGDENRSFLERWAFPVDGAGIASALNAMFRTNDELAEALNDGTCLVANSKILEYLPKIAWTSRWFTKLGWRDGVANFLSFVMLLGQRFTFQEFIVQKSSPESYNNKEGRDAFYEWSLREVQPWL